MMDVVQEGDKEGDKGDKQGDEVNYTEAIRLEAESLTAWG
jgi:hypothetical protein